MFKFFKKIFKSEQDKNILLDINKIKEELKEEIREEIKSEVKEELLKDLSKNDSDSNYNIKKEASPKNESPTEPNKVVYLNDYKGEIKNNSTLICPECKNELIGKKSSPIDGGYYMTCNICNFVSKIYNNKAYIPPNTLSEVNKAYRAFKSNGIEVREYSMEKHGERKRI